MSAVGDYLLFQFTCCKISDERFIDLLGDEICTRKKMNKEHIKKCMFVFIQENILSKVASFVQNFIAQNYPVK